MIENVTVGPGAGNSDMSEPNEPEAFAVEERNGEVQEDDNELLEDEEMPTYISVSSPTRGDEVSRQGTGTADPSDEGPREPSPEEPSPSPSQEGSSVYVLSSGDESEPPTPYDDDDEDEDDLDEDPLDDEIEEIDGFMEEEDEDEVDGEDSEDEGEWDDKRTADDFQLKYHMNMDQKVRSRSLEDLKESDLKPQACLIKKRRSFDILGHKDSEFSHRSSLFSLSRRFSAPIKYQHIESKVKRYIQDRKDQDRRSAEMRRKSREVFLAKECNEHDARGNDQEEFKRSTTNRHIKDYAEKAIKDLENEEARLQNHIGVVHEGENGEDTNHTKECTENRNNDLCLKQPAIGKLNGMMENDIIIESLENTEKFTKTNEDCIVNGEQEVHDILNIHTINYEEYMKNGPISDYKLPVISGTHTVVTENNEGVQYDNMIISESDTGTNNEPCAFRIENVQSIEMTKEEVSTSRDDPVMMMETTDQEIQTTNGPESDVALLKTQLAQKTTENVELRQELEHLKKVLARYQKERQIGQLRAVAVQTDAPAESTEDKEPSGGPSRSTNKLSTSSMGSAVSSNDPWTDSVCSPPITRPPPNLTPIFNSDDSLAEVNGTPRRSSRQPSHAFLTSSRIIKTLSNITRGKSKVDNPNNLKEADNRARFLLKGFASPAISSSSSTSSLNIANPKKRRATEMLGNSNFLQPPKIAHTSRGSQRLQRKLDSDSNVNKDFKYPGDYVKLSSRMNATQLSETKGISENPEDVMLEDDDDKEEGADDLINNVKCFTYQDDDNNQERSFLIQAEEGRKELGEANERGGIVRECGPYLLGNVEVRMSEVNGTINIWGKEVSQESTAEEGQEEESGVPEDLNESRTWHCYQKTPNTRFANSGHMVCSTNKKPKISLLQPNDSTTSYPKSSHSTLASIPKISTSTLADLNVHQQLGCSFDAENVNDSQKRDSHTCTSHKRIPNFLENHSHSCRLKEIIKNRCCCSRDQDNCNQSSCRVARSCQDEHNCSGHTMNPRETSRCSHANNDNFEESTSEGGCIYQTRHCSFHLGEKKTTCQHKPRKDYTFQDNLPLNNPSTSRNFSSTRGRDIHHRDSPCRQCSPSNDNDADPLLPHHSYEPSEVKRRRLSGRRVRGILMDFLRGCGDCKSNNGINNKVNPSDFGYSPSNIRVTPCTPSSSTFATAQQKQSQQRNTNYGSTNRCVHTDCCGPCARRAEMATEIETQLEFFRAEMERLRSRSDAVLDMLNTLHATDLN